MVSKTLCIVSILMLLPLAALAQQDRIQGAIDRQHTVVLKGNVHPNAQAKFDQGPVDADMKMSLITLLLKPSASQQANLDQLLADQQNPASPNYHQWLTPEEYANRFGTSPQDIAKIAAWLKAEGLSVDNLARGRNFIVFHGTAAQVQSAFHTEIHHYRVNGELHFANSTEPSVPAAIQGLVGGIHGLNDFRLKPKSRLSTGQGGQAWKPNYTNGSFHGIAPDDFATIYDVAPLYKSNYTGTGQSIAIAGQTDINLADIRTFRSNVGLPSKDPQIVLAAGSQDPGTSMNDLGEADLDLEWSGAVARNATIIYVNSTDATFSAVYAIDQDIAPVVSLSYGACEAEISDSLEDAMAVGDQFRVVAQQANVQGITWLLASGDSGADDCDPSFDPSNATATTPASVDFPGSIPEVTDVGGTEFNEGNGTYWSNSNGPTLASALSYIPEMAWNETSPGTGLAASGGGLSVLFSKPSWQTGPGVPSANARAVPDVALSAAQHDPYLVTSGGKNQFAAGTSAAAPSFAGIVAILNQYEVATGAQSISGQGNINPNLYRLAQAATGAFHDITTGNNIVPCAPSVSGCVNGSYGFSAGPGYDPVTGLGSIDANNLITQWSKSIVSTQPQPPFHLQLFSGDDQFAAAGAALPQPIIVSAQDANGLPVSGVTVTFSVVFGGGSVSPASAVTNARGLAQTQMILGSATGIQIALASATNFASTGIIEVGGANNNFGFNLSQSGGNQTGPVNTMLPTPLTLTATSLTGQPLPGIQIGWVVTNGGGSLSVPSAVTDSTGKVTANWTLGPQAGTQTVQAIPFYFDGVPWYGPGGPTFTATATGQTGGTGPSVPPNGIVNGAGFNNAEAGLAPGAIASIFGTNLSTVPASGVMPGLAPGTSMLNTTSNGTTVTFDGVPAPLFFISPLQLNVQVPFEVAGTTSSQVVVSLNGSSSAPVTVTILPDTPALFTVNSAGTGPAAALNQDNSTNTSSNGAAAGTVLQLFTTGLGAVSPAVATGVLAPTTAPLAQSVQLPRVTIGGVAAAVEFSGLAPGFVGLWQVNVQVPAGVPSGSNILLLQSGGQNANPVTVFVK